MGLLLSEKKVALRSASLAMLLAIAVLGWGAVPAPAAALDHPIEVDGLWTDGETWLSLGVLAGAGLLAFEDETIRREVQRDDDETLASLADGFNLLGHPLTGLGISATLWGAGALRHDRHLAETGQMALEAVLLGQIATVMVKAGVGRLRPDEREDAWSFRPFSLASERDSFPSGHTASAFALAGVLSRRSESDWAPWLYYGLASLVGAARVYDDEHWASDAVVGALVGELAARLTMHFHRRNPGFFFGAGPLGSEGAGVQLTLRW